MSRSRWLAAAVFALTCVSTYAAGQGLVTWDNWVVETDGQNVSKVSSDAVPTDWTTYLWITYCPTIELQLGNAVWLDVTKEFGDTKTRGTNHALPITVYNKHMHLEGQMDIDMLHQLNAAGHLESALSNVAFGSVSGTPITGFRGTMLTSVRGYKMQVLDTQINWGNGHSYFLLNGSLRSDAEQKAVELGGHLVTINDRAENDWLFGKFGGGPRQLWIGLNDNEKGGGLSWLSGEPVTYTNWEIGYPWTVPNFPQNYVCYMRADNGKWVNFLDEYADGGIVEVNYIVPEPSVLVLCLGLAGLGLIAAWRRRRKRV